MKPISLIFLLLFAIPALAQDEETKAADFLAKTTRDLYQACTISEDNAFHDKATAFCYGYILSAFHYDAALHQRKKEERLVCPEPDTSLLDLIAAFRHWAEQNPQYLDELPVEGVMRSAMQQWPCR